jgi:hypothetical protein
MWLLNAASHELKEFNGEIPPYAILSHTWSQEEASFKEVRKHLPNAHRKAGFRKLELCCLQAREDGLEWVWIDSCCIDKRSSAELSEAINSMFKWYRNAHICYAYLEDIPPQRGSLQQATLAASRWFTRGWTLQELLAPSEIRFYASDWSLLGTKSAEDHSFSSQLSQITDIDILTLCNISGLRDVSIATRMSWAAKRVTTREEDRAYSLMGIFHVHMPILYGEGLQSAFERLQREIIQMTSDQSIFAWRSNEPVSSLNQGFGLLAQSPSYFENSAFPINNLQPRLRPFAITNVGIQITLRLMPYDRHIPGIDDIGDDIWLATLRCWSSPNVLGVRTRLQLLLREKVIVEGSGFRVFQRIFPHILCSENDETPDTGRLVEMFIPNSDQIEHLEIIGTIR